MDLVKELAGGLSNKIYLINDAVLLRIFGQHSDALVNSKNERYVMRELGKRGIAPQILLEFDNGRLEQFIKNSRSLSLNDLVNQQILENLVIKIKEIHHTELELDKTPVLCKNIENWFVEAKKVLPDHDVYEFKDTVIGLINGATTVGICLCHNDLQKNNILINKDDSTVKLIDFEYSGYNYIEFDIANFLCELSIDYLDSEFKINEEVDIIIQKRICTLYLQDPDLFDNLKPFIIAAHFLWTLWAIVKSGTGGSFDYRQYANVRFNMLKRLI